MNISGTDVLIPCKNQELGTGQALTGVVHDNTLPVRTAIAVAGVVVVAESCNHFGSRLRSPLLRPSLASLQVNASPQDSGGHDVCV